MENIGLLVLRLFSGGLMMTHGFQKFQDYATYVEKFADPIGLGPELSLQLAIFAELVCAAFLLVGLFSRLSLIPLIITMMVAAFIAHAGDPLQKKELALMYLGCYLTLFMTGPGKISVQSMFKISAGRFEWLLK